MTSSGPGPMPFGLQRRPQWLDGATRRDGPCRRSGHQRQRLLPASRGRCRISDQAAAQPGRQLVRSEIERPTGIAHRSGGHHRHRLNGGCIGSAGLQRRSRSDLRAVVLPGGIFLVRRCAQQSSRFAKSEIRWRLRPSQSCTDRRNPPLYSCICRLWRHHPCKSVLAMGRRLGRVGDCWPSAPSV